MKNKCYCEKCGTELREILTPKGRYHDETGELIHTKRMKCPSAGEMPSNWFGIDIFLPGKMHTNYLVMGADVPDEFAASGKELY